MQVSRSEAFLWGCGVLGLLMSVATILEGLVR